MHEEADDSFTSKTVRKHSLPAREGQTKKKKTEDSSERNYILIILIIYYDLYFMYCYLQLYFLKI